MPTDNAAKPFEWYVVDHDNNDKIVRGPYADSATAQAVRAELEHAGDERNLWVVAE